MFDFLIILWYYKFMRLVIISDTHGQMDKIVLPEGDILIHAGDATYQGTVAEISKFNNHLEPYKDKYKHILFVPGNHDWLFETNKYEARKIMTNATVLIDEEIIIEGKKFYGSPWQPEFCAWAFNVKRGPLIARKWDLIPTDTNILITHGPVKGILDTCPDGFRAGCEELWKKVVEIKPELHICGHIHHAYGMQNFNGTTFINASICDEMYMTTNKPFVVDL